MLPYIDEWVSKGHKLHQISKHLLQLFAGQPGTKAWKRYISENSHFPGADSGVIWQALQQVNSQMIWLICQLPIDLFSFL